MSRNPMPRSCTCILRARTRVLLGPPQNNVPAFRNWIDDGQTPNDISYLINNNMVRVSMPGPSTGASALPDPKNWKDGPGLKDTLQSDFYSQMNVPI
jgi:hypothetical protein